MIFVGFGFLMVFLKTHSWTSVGFNYLIAAWSLQIAVLSVGFWHQVIEGKKEWQKIPLDLPALIFADLGAAAVLISLGAVLGKHSLMQLWILATLEVFFYGLNEAICRLRLGAVDLGCTITVHTFGAYFGLAACYFFDNKKAIEDKTQRCSGNYNSQLVAMVGTLFLFMYWPSYNAVLGQDFQQQRIIVNTVLSITGSAISACAVTRLFLLRLDMEVVLKATLAGGVAMGAGADLVT